MLGVLHIYTKFAFKWCTSECESVGAILVIGGISMVCVSHCVVLVLRIFVWGVKKVYSFEDVYYALEVDMFVEDFIRFEVGVKCICSFYWYMNVVLCRHE